MYTMSSKLKLFSLALIIVGAIGLIYGFIDAPSSVEDVKEMLHAEDAAHSGEVAIGSMVLTKQPMQMNMLSMYFINCKTNLGQLFTFQLYLYF